MDNTSIVKKIIAIEAIVMVLVLVIVGVAHSSSLKEDATFLKDKVSSLKDPSESKKDNTTESTEGTDLEAKKETATDNQVNKEKRLVFSTQVEEKIASMSDEEKVAQLFMVTTEQLTDIEAATIFGNNTKEKLKQYPVGGILYNENNMTGYTPLQTMLSETRSYYKEHSGFELFTAVEELGGEAYSPVAVACGLDVGLAPYELGERGELELVGTEASVRAEYLNELNFNMVFGPCVEPYTSDTDEVNQKLYSSVYDVVKSFASTDIKSLRSNQMYTAAGCFPCSTNNQENSASEVQLDEALELWKAVVEAGTSAIVVNNDPFKSITKDEALPCSMSSDAIAVLRDDLGFEGILMTDELSAYDSIAGMDETEAVVSAINAGMDMIQCPKDFKACYKAVLDALKNGIITKNRIHNALGHILTAKMEM